jgi:uncharacterized repeat protein (TIGR03803 family)
MTLPCPAKVPSVTLLAVMIASAAIAQAQAFTTLYNFNYGSDGNTPFAGVVQDPSGNLYGTAFWGGDPNCSDGSTCGVVFKLDTAGKETVLHRFSGPDGAFPVTPVVRDTAGNIYGTTSNGGLKNNGTAFKIDTTGHLKVLHSFSGADGCFPEQGLVQDKAGNLYGTTWGCGTYNHGTIFKLDSAGNFTLLHSFAGPPSDGAEPQYKHLTIDPAGNLYGVTMNGGSGGCQNYYGSGCGVLYKLSRGGAFTMLHSFTGADGCFPNGSVTRDIHGNLYGTTYQCGSDNYGTIWKASATGKETILHDFAGGTSDGCYPAAGLTRDSKGNLYGVTYECGYDQNGVLYKLGASGTYTLLHRFDFTDGAALYGEVLLTTDGNLLGTAGGGGTYGQGTVWRYAP